jgi:putative nucleotidyltransferase with HDIG domain
MRSFQMSKNRVSAGAQPAKNLKQAASCPSKATGAADGGLSHEPAVWETCGMSSDNNQPRCTQTETFGQFVQALVLTLSKRDPYTGGHQHRVQRLAIAIAAELGLPVGQIEGLRLAAAIHDLGKISVPSEILNKPAHLTEAEFAIIKTHPVTGYDILKEIKFPWPVARVVRQHHERLNGSGYPDGISGGDIVIEARILAVADVIEAMSSHRPYRAALGMDAALDEINRHSGQLYDPEVVDAGIRLLLIRKFNFDFSDHRAEKPGLAAPNFSYPTYTAAASS